MRTPSSSPRPTRLLDFARDERGVLTIEAVIMLPVLIFLFVAGFAYFDAYRREAQIDRASYAVSDLLSRREDVLDPTDLEGLQDLFEALTRSAPNATYMRFSELHRTPAGIAVVWSYATDDQLALTTPRAQGLLRRIPTLAAGERVTLVESFSIEEPFFAVGLRDRIVTTAVPTRQRYAPRLVFAPGTDRRADASVTPNDLDCGDAAVPVNGKKTSGPGNCG